MDLLRSRSLTLRAIGSRIVLPAKTFWARMGIVVQGPKASFAAHDAQYSQSSALEYERAAAKRQYDLDAANNREFRLNELIARNPQLNDAIAVDIGSGTGWLSGWLADRFARVESIEPSAAAVQIAKEIQKEKSGRIRWHVGLSENILPTLSIDKPALFVTGRVLSHMTDRAVKKVVAAIDRKAVQGSVVCLTELWGTPYHRALWHVRSQEWWQAAFGHQWKLDFLANPVETENRFVGIHGRKIEKIDRRLTD